ncbi:hypothetical protein LAZ67_13002972 [Cordylochernes scorpioides]|uniref:Fibronectin type-III domain-containing protein n=1 Tax=Cordylochernes scorpioides TaxID=51811 RepID=A0ABY6L7J2_9ARAC|nr:hypothetical protein LAZ67_13002972 [Cordylochernes scorpioides]
MFPPAPVRDLRVTNVEDDIVTLRWTSPGDNMDYGNVSYVEVRLDEDPEALLKNFTSSKLLEEKDLVNGTLSPPPGGQIHEISIRIPISLDQPKTIFFAVVGVDSSGLRADSWSIFPANLGKLGRPPPTFDLAWKIGIVIVIITLVIATALLIHFLKRRRQNQDIPVAYSKS